ncbi:MAG: PEP-CTERM sorting domain-containing protein [Gammaproteobacteria bacterium]
MRTLAAVVLAGAVLGFSSGASATFVTDLLYATESDDLRAIPFDGSSFGGFATVLESGFTPGWTGISYDWTADLLYYSTASDDLRVIGFDGTSFTGGFATVLESGFTPAWAGISVIVEAPIAAVPEPAVLPLALFGLVLLAAVHRRNGARTALAAA